MFRVSLVFSREAPTLSFLVILSAYWLKEVVLRLCRTGEDVGPSCPNFLSLMHLRAACSEGMAGLFCGLDSVSLGKLAFHVALTSFGFVLFLHTSLIPLAPSSGRRCHYTLCLHLLATRGLEGKLKISGVSSAWTWYTNRLMWCILLK